MATNKIENELREIPGERGIPSANDEKRNSSTAARVLFLLASLVVIGGVAYFSIFSGKKNDNSQALEEQQIVNNLPSRTFALVPEPTPAPVAPVPIEIAQPPVAIPTAQEPPKPEPPRLNRSASSLAPTNMANRSAQGTAQTSAQANTTQADNSTYQIPYGNETPDEPAGSLNSRLTSTQTQANSAGMLGDRNYILTKGSFINCVMQTRLDSTVPGMSACRVIRNVYSHNGNVLLIERGSIVSGEYQSNVQKGQIRIFVLWNRIVTPNGVVITLDSPGTDQLGGGGIPGYIDSHFFERYGGAILLSVISDLGDWLVNQANDSEWNINSTSSSVQDMAAEALKNSINIPPTLYVNHGEEIGIYVARDLDFSGVYNVRSAP